MWISGRAGKIRAADILVLLHALWAAIALIVAHGFQGGVEPAGIYFIEVMGAYLVARIYIRSRNDFEALVRILFQISLILLPLAALESISGIHVFNDIIEAIAPSASVVSPYNLATRMGLTRAFGPFEHPILFGVFSASILGLAYYVLGRDGTRFAAAVRAGLVTVATFFSLSAGPLVALGAQLCLMIWNRATRRMPRRWIFLGAGALAAYVIIDILSNRTPIEVFISFFTFNVNNSYYRVLIWDYGTAEVLRNPLFGIGFNEWARAYWMHSSIDNFWLVLAIRFGFPGLIFLVAAILLLCVKLGAMRKIDSLVYDYRKGWIISILGVAIAGGTVHLWNAIFCFYIFLLGSGVWMLERESADRPTSFTPTRNLKLAAKGERRAGGRHESRS